MIYNNILSVPAGKEEYKIENIHPFLKGKCYNTSKFGFTSRYVWDNKKMIWGYPGIHWGVDLVAGKDILISFLDFDRSEYHDYKNKLWGTDVLLFHRLGFRVRICHMYPNEILILNELKSKLKIPINTNIGRTGSYGNSTGRHAHIEVEAWGYTGKWLNTCEALDFILYRRYGKETIIGYSEKEIIKLTRKCKKSKTWPESLCLSNYEKICDKKKIVFMNKYKLVRLVGKNKKPTTLYNAELLLCV